MNNYTYLKKYNCIYIYIYIGHHAQIHPFYPLNHTKKKLLHNATTRPSDKKITHNIRAGHLLERRVGFGDHTLKNAHTEVPSFEIPKPTVDGSEFRQTS